MYYLIELHGQIYNVNAEQILRNTNNKLIFIIRESDRFSKPFRK